MFFFLYFQILIAQSPYFGCFQKPGIIDVFMYIACRMNEK